MDTIPFADESRAVGEFRELENGGEGALGLLFENYRHRLRRMVELRIDARLSQRVDASDVLQEGFVDASRRLTEYVEKPTLPPFLWLRFLVTQRLAAVQRWHFQRQKRDPRREQALPAAGSLSHDTSRMAIELSANLTSPSFAMAREEMTSQLQMALDSMEPIDREILVLRHYEELSNAEAAAELGLGTSTASKRYVRALTRLRQVIDNTASTPR